MHKLGSNNKLKNYHTIVFVAPAPATTPVTGRTVPPIVIHAIPGKTSPTIRSIIELTTKPTTKQTTEPTKATVTKDESKSSDTTSGQQSKLKLESE